MSGLALVAHALGAQVTGSDRSDSAYLEPLREEGIVPVIGHAAENIPAGDDVEVVVSTAIAADNPERAAAAARGLRELHRSELLAEVSAAEAHAGRSPGRTARRRRARWPPTPCCAWGRTRRTSSAASCARRAATRPGARGSGSSSRPTSPTARSCGCRPSSRSSRTSSSTTTRPTARKGGGRGRVRRVPRPARDASSSGTAPDAEAFLDRSGIGEAAFFRADDVELTPGRLGVHVGRAARAPLRAGRAQRRSTRPRRSRRA